MGRKTKVPIGEKLRAIEDYLSGKRGTSQICYELQIHKSSFQAWLRKYQIEGKQGLQTLRANKCYPDTIKLQAVTDYNNGEGSLNQISSKYCISSHGLLLSWVNKYNGHETFKTYNALGDRFMTKGRKTTYEERTEIVAFCVENNDNYQITSDRFQVSYQQVYTWVKKYKDQGYEALLDRRGIRKNTEELSETEKLAAQLKLVEAENKHLKMEIDFLKKLDEVERRR
ncbi:MULTISPECIES: helix-turn-helix domain-containing protein [Dehalobacter]|uniref:helix-turn-helix domain-containing protein n=1 Tax=Dehalobacter TaxID=56112 RepID=UPI002587B788|nr:helix-turn-helix domain-containing protein [Dehalobacter sp.]MDJ0305882.1 helix-turn-helix domain-containing protein [Dehalobacter sp.]